MTARISDAFLDTTFVGSALQALASEGFLSDKHPFVPSRDALQTHAAKISSKLTAQGFTGRLKACFMRHERAGFTYILYDDALFRDHDEASSAVSEWLDKSFGQESRIWLKWSGQRKEPNR
jgi:hypothetical protein